MKKSAASPSTMDQYILGFPPDVQKRLTQMRKAIQGAAPLATETISYQIPTFQLNGNLVHFAAFEHHIGFYPGPAGIASFEDELAVYKHAKGSVQFPLDAPLPLALVKKIVAFRVAQNLAKKSPKKKDKAAAVKKAPAQKKKG